MSRRRRSAGETAFSFDSFLDLVTNVVGIIIRLILVAWVGARSYDALPDVLKQMQAQLTAPPVAPADLPPLPDDPLAQELARQRRELAAAESRLLDQLRQLDMLKEDRTRTEQKLTALTALRRQLLKNETDLEQVK